MLNGIDVSDDQRTIDFAQLKTDPSAQFMFAQATEGLTIVNTTFKPNHDGAKANGIPFGAYHFFYAKDDGAAQAAHFLSFIDGYEGELLPMVDCEADSLAGFAGNYQEFIANLGKFDNAVRKTLNGKLPIIYFGYSFWQTYLKGYTGFSGHPAWPAAYNDDPQLNMGGTGWRFWTLWQWSDGSGLPPIAGIETNVDRSRLLSLDMVTR